MLHWPKQTDKALGGRVTAMNNFCLCRRNCAQVSHACRAPMQTLTCVDPRTFWKRVSTQVQHGGQDRETPLRLAHGGCGCANRWRRSCNRMQQGTKEIRVVLEQIVAKSFQWRMEMRSHAISKQPVWQHHHHGSTRRSDSTLH